MIAAPLPTEAGALTLEVLNSIIGAHVPSASLTGFTVIESHEFGSGQASTAGRVVIEPAYAAASPAGLPRRVVIKLARTDPEIMSGPGGQNIAHGLYANEVAVYTRLKPEQFLETPRSLGGAYDPASQTFLLLLEDLRDRGAKFANVTIPTSLGRLQSLLDSLSTLHARYWNGPALTSTLGWMETHLRGEIHDLFNTAELVPRAIGYLLETVQFKREMVQRMGTTADKLFRGFQLTQQHQARLPQTVCHGDTHIGNTYILSGDRGGLIDWQLASRGFALHDVSYIMATALSVADRRQHERDLLAYYRDQLRAKGVAEVPSAETLWLEYRRAMVWGVYIGWLTTPVINYGWEISVMSHLRVMTAFEDLETGKLLEAMD